MYYDTRKEAARQHHAPGRVYKLRSSAPRKSIAGEMTAAEGTLLLIYNMT